MAIICNSTTIKTVKVGDTEIFEVGRPYTFAGEDHLDVWYNKFTLEISLKYRGAIVNGSSYTINWNTQNKHSGVKMIIYYTGDQDDDITIVSESSYSSGSVTFVLPATLYNPNNRYIVGVSYSYKSYLTGAETIREGLSYDDLPNVGGVNKDPISGTFYV